MATLVTADLQSIAQIVYKTPGTVWFVALTGSDSNDGKSWATAKLSPKTTIEGAAAGDVVLLAAGVYALGANYINTPDGVSVRGAGMYETVITSALYWTGTGNQVCSFRVPGNAELRDFTVADAGVWAILSGTGTTTVAGNFCFPLGVWGSPPAAFNNALVRRVRTIGDTDALNVNASSPCSGTFEDCEFQGKVDNTTVKTAAHVIQFVRCRHVSIGPSISQPADGQQGMTIGSPATVYSFDDNYLAAGSAVGIGADTGTLFLLGGRVASVQVSDGALSGAGSIESGTTAANVACIGTDYDRFGLNSSLVYDVPSFAGDNTGIPTFNVQNGAAMQAWLYALSKLSRHGSPYVYTTQGWSQPPVYAWKASDATITSSNALGQLMTPGNGHFYICTVVTGRSTATGPGPTGGWNTTGGTSVNQQSGGKSYTWQDLGPIVSGLLSATTALGSPMQAGATVVATGPSGAALATSSQLPTFPANFAALAISSGGVVQATDASGSALATHSDVTGLAGSILTAQQARDALKLALVRRTRPPARSTRPWRPPLVLARPAVCRRWSPATAARGWA